MITDKIECGVMSTSGNIITLDQEAQISARRIFSIIANDLAQVELEFERQARSNVQVIDFYFAAYNVWATINISASVELAYAAAAPVGLRVQPAATRQLVARAAEKPTECPRRTPPHPTTSRAASERAPAQRKTPRSV